jgi:hypothetical protein
MVYAHKKCIHKISIRDGFKKYLHFDRHTQESTKRKYPHFEVSGQCTQEIYSQNIHTLLGTPTDIIIVGKSAKRSGDITVFKPSFRSSDSLNASKLINMFNV